MASKVIKWQMAGFLFTAVLGTLLHFVYEWSGENTVASLFSAINESTWEHMKLLFYPMMAFGVIEYFRWGRQVPSFWCIKLLGALLGLVLIPVIYYTYTGALGVNVDWFNITIFFLVAGVSYWMETRLFLNGFRCKLPGRAALFLLVCISAAFTVLTFTSPNIPFFR